MCVIEGDVGGGFGGFMSGDSVGVLLLRLYVIVQIVAPSRNRPAKLLPSFQSGGKLYRQNSLP